MVPSTPVSIFVAVYGHMIIQISGEEEAQKAKRYLDSIKMSYHELDFSDNDNEKISLEKRKED